jgi:hypothetical protein
MSGKPLALQANMDQFVGTIGHLLLMKVDPDAAKRRNLTRMSLDEGSHHEAPRRSHSRNSSAGEPRHGA